MINTAHLKHLRIINGLDFKNITKINRIDTTDRKRLYGFDNPISIE